MSQGKCIIFSAPSGAGKTTIVHAMLEKIKTLEFSVSACSRPPRKKEVHAEDYYFLSVDEFKKKIQNEEFLEWEEVYEQSFYGTLKSEIERIWSKNHHVIFDVDVIGGIHLKNYLKENALSIFVQPPSLKTLKKRLKNRKTEGEASIQSRVNKAEKELEYANQFDVVLLNDNLEETIKNAAEKITSFIENKMNKP